MKYWKDAKRTYRFLLKNAPLAVAELFFWGAVSAVLPLAGMAASGKLFAQIGSVAEGKSPDWTAVAVYALYLFVAALPLLYHERYYATFAALTGIERRLSGLLQEKVHRVSDEQLLSGAFHRKVQIASFAATNLYRFLQCVSDILWTGLSMAFAGVAVLALHPLFFVILCITLASVVLELRKETALQKAAQPVQVRANRLEKAYADAIISPDAMAETAIGHYGELFLEKFRSARAEKVRCLDGLYRTVFRWRNLLSPLEAIGATGGFLLGIYLLAGRKIDLARFGAAVAAFEIIRSNIRNLFQTLGESERFSSMSMPYFAMMDAEERKGENAALPVPYAMRAEGARFRYPAGDRDVLEGIDFTLHPGEVVGIVGANGSGKTTLTRLLAGEFLPTGGRVCFGEHSTCEVSEDCLYDALACVPQDFARYQMRADENVGFSRAADAHPALARFFSPDELAPEEMLGKAFGGRELSGGQWQKLAIARASMKNAHVLFLDEPTSAIDPLYEKRLFEEFRRELAGKSGLIVTHRMGAISLCDRIVVLDGGRIVEEGAFAALMEKKGKFFELYTAQSDLFSEEQA